MVTKVHGGVPQEFQNLTGHLTFIKVTADANTTFTQSVGDGTTAGLNPADPDLIYEDGQVVPYSDLETVIKAVNGRSTVVISSVESDLVVHFAVENAGDAWFFNGAPDTTAPGTSNPNLQSTIEKALLAMGVTAAITINLGSFRVG